VSSFPRPSTTTDVGQLTAHITQLARGKNMGIVPEIPTRNSGDTFLVALDDSALSAADFCNLASIAGARLLYVRAASFDADSDHDLDIGGLGWMDAGREANAERAALYRDAVRFNGCTSEVVLAFITDSVLHCWSMAADWYNDLLERAAMLPDEALDAEPGAS
jgi:hypothetical protein